MKFGDQDTVSLVGSMFLCLQLLLLVVPVYKRVRTRKFDSLEIGLLFAFLYCLYSVPLGLEKLYFEAGNHGWTPALYFVVTSLGLAGFWLGYNSTFGRHLGTVAPRFGSATNIGIAVSAAALFAVGVVLMALFLERMGGVAAYLAIGYGGALYLAEGGSGHLLVGEDLILLSLALLWLHSVKTKNLVSRSLFFVGVIPFVYFKVRMGDRGTILALIIVLIAQQHYLVKRFSRKKAIAFLLAGYTVGVIFGAARFWIVREDLSRVPQDTVANFNVEWLLPGNVGEFTAPAASLYELIDHPRFFEYQYGYSYFVFLRNFMPEAIVPDRVPTLAEWYVRNFQPAVSDIGGGRGFFTAGEAFVNFGYIGPLLQLFIYGIVLRAIYEWFRRQSWNPAAVIVYASCLVWIFPLVRIDLATALRGALIRGVIPALIAGGIMVFGKLRGEQRLLVPSGESCLIRRQAIHPQ